MSELDPSIRGSIEDMAASYMDTKLAWESEAVPGQVLEAHYQDFVYFIAAQMATNPGQAREITQAALSLLTLGEPEQSRDLAAQRFRASLSAIEAEIDSRG